MGFRSYLKDQLASFSALTLLVWSYAIRFLVVITGILYLLLCTTSTLLRELVSLRGGHLFLDGGCQLTRSELSANEI